MKELKKILINYLKGYSFNELKIFLNLQKDPDVRETFLNAMEIYYPEEFLNFIEGVFNMRLWHYKLILILYFTKYFIYYIIIPKEDWYYGKKLFNT